MRKSIFSLFLFIITSSLIFAQNTIIEGHVFENGNQKNLNLVQIKVFKRFSNKLLVSTLSDINGLFSVQILAGKTYIIKTEKDQFVSQKIRVITRKKDKDKKVFTKIEMHRILGNNFENALAKNNIPNHGEVLSEEIAKDVKSYGIDTKKIIPNVNPKGVSLQEEFSDNDPYSDITNGTRLTDEYYKDAADRELMKRENMPTSYSVPSGEKVINTNRNIPPQKPIPTAYEEAAAAKRIVVPSQFGETVVSVAGNTARTRYIPINYTGYRVEFVTSLEELKPSHKIFSQHGNITLEQKSNGVYSYLLGNFYRENEAVLFLNEVMKPRYPTANIVYFINGKRTNKGRAKVKTKPVSAPPR